MATHALLTNATDTGRATATAHTATAGGRGVWHCWGTFDGCAVTVKVHWAGYAAGTGGFAARIEAPVPAYRTKPDGERGFALTFEAKEIVETEIWPDATYTATVANAGSATSVSLTLEDGD